MNRPLVQVDSNNSSSGALSLEVEAERLKHFFYMLHGEPSTRTRPFPGAILVTKDEVVSLIDSLIQQLELFHVDDYAINVNIGFKNQFIEKTFTDFKNSNWGDSERTEEITIKINFLYKDHSSGNPLKNSIFIRIARGIKPGNYLQLLASNDSEKLDNLEQLMCPLFCRTDHLSDRLSKAIMNVVEEWHAGQKQPPILKPVHNFFRNHKLAAARFVHYLYPIAVSFALFLFSFLIPLIGEGSEIYSYYFGMILLSFILISLLSDIGKDKATTVFQNLSELSSDDVIFDITKGDNKEYSEAFHNNNNHFKKFLKITFWTLAQSVVAGIVSSVIFDVVKDSLK